MLDISNDHAIFDHQANILKRLVLIFLLFMEDCHHQLWSRWKVVEKIWEMKKWISLQLVCMTKVFTPSSTDHRVMLSAGIQRSFGGPATKQQKWDCLWVKQTEDKNSLLHEIPEGPLANCPLPPHGGPRFLDRRTWDCGLTRLEKDPQNLVTARGGDRNLEEGLCNFWWGAKMTTKYCL